VFPAYLNGSQVSAATFGSSASPKTKHEDPCVRKKGLGQAYASTPPEFPSALPTDCPPGHHAVARWPRWFRLPDDYGSHQKPGSSKQRRWALMGFSVSIAQKDWLNLFLHEANCKGLCGNHKVNLTLLSPSKRLTLLSSLRWQGD